MFWLPGLASFWLFGTQLIKLVSTIYPKIKITGTKILPSLSFLFYANVDFVSNYQYSFPKSDVFNMHIVHNFEIRKARAILFQKLKKFHQLSLLMTYLFLKMWIEDFCEFSELIEVNQALFPAFNSESRLCVE